MRVLLIADDAFSEAVIREALRESGIPCTDLRVMHDGRQALDLLLSPRAEARAQRPDLVLIDLSSPSVPGTEIFDRMRADARLRHIPALVVTMSPGPPPS